MLRFLDNSEQRRRSFDLSTDTNAYRLVDGDGDELPGIHIDVLAGRRLVATTKGQQPAELKTWAVEKGHCTYWKRLDQQERESPIHLAGPEQTEPFEILEHGVRYEISFQSGYSQGLFLDQRDNRRRVRERCSQGDTVLNTFAYTGAFSVCAALGGADTTTLDLSQPYLDWARRNMHRNGIVPDEHFFCKGDTFHWLRRFARQRRTFTGIVLDPPTFSRDDKGKVFRAEEDYGLLVELAAACLAPSGWLLCTTNCARLPLAHFQRMVREALPKKAHLDAFPMPPDFTGEQYLKSLLVAW